MTARARLPLALVALPAALCCATTVLHADDPELLWTFQGGENIVCLTPIEDIDGDGGPDIVLEGYDAGCSLPDHLFCIRGASSGAGEAIWGAWPPGGVSSGGGYGDNCLTTSPDLTGDGVEDVLLGTAWGGRSAYVLDGTNGDDIWWIFDTYSESPPSPPTSGWVYAIDPVADLNGDGRPEVAFCAGSYNYGVYMADGATGAILWFYQYSAPFCELTCVGDVDGDGYEDIAAGASDQNYRLLCFSGPGQGGSAEVLWSYLYPASIWTIIALPSVDADDLPEVVAGSWDGVVRCHRGTDGAVLWSSVDFGVVVQRIVRVGDVNGNGHPDILCGLWDNRVVMIEGLDGTSIWTQWVGTLNGGDTWAVDGVGDLTGDGIPDAVVGSFDTQVYLMDGVDGTILWSYPVGNRVMTIRGVPDLNANGSPDFVAGTQMLTGGSGGRAYAFDGPVSAAAPPPDASGPALRCWPSVMHAGGGALLWRIAPPEAGRVRLELVTSDGRVAHTLCDLDQAGGSDLSGRWARRDARGSPAAAGVYWLRATIDGRDLASERIVLLP